MVDMLLVENIICDYMKENNIEDINDIDKKIIQQKYDEILIKQIWEKPDKL